MLEKTTYPNSVEIARSNHYSGRIDTLTRDPDGTPETLAAYEYLGPRVAQRSYSTPSIDYQPTYDNLGRLTEIDYTNPAKKLCVDAWISTFSYQSH